MTLTAGTRLGPYEILAPLGAGGMGEVYRARDPRLGRDVAVKVLPASLSADPDRLRRFEQEAKAAGVLNHPNVTAVYDIGRRRVAHENARFPRRGAGSGGARAPARGLVGRASRVLRRARRRCGGAVHSDGAAWGDRPTEIFLSHIGSPETRSLGIPEANLLSVAPSGELAILLKK
ncbi:MAG TPA: hypothetical protein VMR54_04640, partial [Thermoanaerobaculia bacterium]|nr:hypothetical protein [Thermoanaerobaculia bacterium]